MAAALPEAAVASRDAAAAAAGDVRVRWGAAANLGRRLAGQRRSRPARGSSGGTTLLPPLAACSLAVLAFLGDPAASFQVRVRVFATACVRGVGEPLAVVGGFPGRGQGLAKVSLLSYSLLAHFDGWAADIV